MTLAEGALLALATLPLLAIALCLWCLLRHAHRDCLDLHEQICTLIDEMNDLPRRQRDAEELEPQ